MRAVDQKPEYHLEWPNNNYAHMPKQYTHMVINAVACADY